MTDRRTRCSLSGPAAALALLLACSPVAPKPSELDTRNEQCASCRMAVSNARFAAQVVAPGEVARFFDDLGCLRTFLASGKAPAGAVAFVADHRTKEWVRLEQAVITRVPGLETPMSSHLIAHVHAASRDRDDDAAGGSPVPVAEVAGGR